MDLEWVFFTCGRRKWSELVNSHGFLLSNIFQIFFVICKQIFHQSSKHFLLIHIVHYTNSNMKGTYMRQIKKLFWFQNCLQWIPSYMRAMRFLCIAQTDYLLAFLRSLDLTTSENCTHKGILQSLCRVCKIFISQSLYGQLSKRGFSHNLGTLKQETCHIQDYRTSLWGTFCYCQTSNLSCFLVEDILDSLSAISDPSQTFLEVLCVHIAMRYAARIKIVKIDALWSPF